MTKKKHFEVSVHVSVVDVASSYDHKALAKIHLTEAVPEGVEPVAHLRNLINSNFARVFGPVEVLLAENSDEVV